MGMYICTHVCIRNAVKAKDRCHSMAKIPMSHVANLNELCHTCECKVRLHKTFPNNK